MYDYMKALHERFSFISESSGELYEKAAKAYDELHGELDAKQRKLLLRLGDAEDARCEEAGFSGFLAGFHLAVGLAAELHYLLPTFLYEDDNEERAKRGE